MVYFNPQLENDSFFALEHSYPGGYRPVKIVYNGSGIHNITGPVPTISISRQLNKNDTGYLNSTNVSINLNGKIFRNNVDTNLDPPGTGTNVIFGAIENLKKVFIDQGYNGIFEVKCGGSGPTDGTTIFSATGVRVTSFNADKTNDNWVFSADYTVDLEYIENNNPNGFSVKSTDDSWSIEPLEDYMYSNINMVVTQKPEHNNPLLQPRIPNQLNPVPQTNIDGSQVGNILLSAINIPRFKINRKVSAVGNAVGTGNFSTNSAYLEAKKWVENRISSAYVYSPESGLISLAPGFSQPGSDGANFLYNHLRNTNFNVNAGSYEVNETWLAMPTGLKYLEDYSIECSTDDKFVKTVTVQGEIQGLNISQLSDLSGGFPHLATNSSGNNVINLDGSLQNTYSYASRFNNLDTNSASRYSLFSQNKYTNALSGWIQEIKPYVYRRACLMTTPTQDRTSNLINPTTASNLFLKPSNPIFSIEKPLNIVPISTSETHNPRKGTISYNHQFTNKYMFLSGVITENININDTNPTDVISEVFVLGRRLGPVLQNLGARTSAKRDITIDISVPTPSSPGGFFLNNTECPVYTGGIVWSGIEVLIEGLKPFGDRPTSIFGNFSQRGVDTNDFGQVYKQTDTHSWNPTDGKFTRNVSWVYQPCTNIRPIMNN